MSSWRAPPAAAPSPPCASCLAALIGASRAPTLAAPPRDAAAPPTHAFALPRLSKALVRELSVIGFGLIALFSSVFGCLLAVFVPQSCGARAVVDECSLEENVYVDITPFNAVVLAFNFLTLALVLAGFAVEFARERFIVLHFDVDYSQPDDNLNAALAQGGAHAALRARLRAWNHLYHNLFLLISGVAALNAALSAALCFSPQYFAGFRGASTFITNTLFLAQRLANSVIVSEASAAEAKAQSVNLVEPMTFNVLAGAACSVEVDNAARAAAGAARDAAPLPPGWRECRNEAGAVWFADADGRTAWERPAAGGAAPLPAAEAARAAAPLSSEAARAPAPGARRLDVLGLTALPGARLSRYARGSGV